MLSMTQCFLSIELMQKAVLEPAMQGRDVIGRAKTGTGKTLAFGIPIMDKIIQYNAEHGFVVYYIFYFGYYFHE